MFSRSNLDVSPISAGLIMLIVVDVANKRKLGNDAKKLLNNYKMMAMVGERSKRGRNGVQIQFKVNLQSRFECPHIFQSVWPPSVHLCE